MVRYHYDMYMLETRYEKKLIEENAFTLRATDEAYREYTFDSVNGIFTMEGSLARISHSSFRTAVAYRANNDINNLSRIAATGSGRFLAIGPIPDNPASTTRSFDIYEASPFYIRGAYMRSFISTDEEEEAGLYPVNGYIVEFNSWFIRREVYSPYPKMKVDGSIREYSDGWVKVNGVLRQIDSMSVKVNGEIREV